MLLLRSVELRPKESTPQGFPYALPFVKTFERLDFLPQAYLRHLMKE